MALAHIDEHAQPYAALYRLRLVCAPDSSAHLTRMSGNLQWWLPEIATIIHRSRWISAGQTKEAQHDTEGCEDASGGISFRAKDAQSYLLVRANSRENNSRFYTIANGRRSTIASDRVREPRLGAWHAFRVIATGRQVQGDLDGARLLDHEKPALRESTAPERSEKATSSG